MKKLFMITMLIGLCFTQPVYAEAQRIKVGELEFEIPKVYLPFPERTGEQETLVIGFSYPGLKPKAEYFMPDDEIRVSLKKAYKGPSLECKEGGRCLDEVTRRYENRAHINSYLDGKKEWEPIYQGFDKVYGFHKYAPKTSLDKPWMNGTATYTTNQDPFNPGDYWLTCSGPIETCESFFYFDKEKQYLVKYVFSPIYFIPNQAALQQAIRDKLKSFLVNSAEGK